MTATKHCARHLFETKPPLATVTRILADMKGARRCFRLAHRNGRTPEVGQRRIIDDMVSAIRAIDEAYGSCAETDLYNIGFTWPEIEAFGAAAARVAIQCKGFDAVDADQALEAA